MFGIKYKPGRGGLASPRILLNVVFWSVLVLGVAYPQSTRAEKSFSLDSRGITRRTGPDGHGNRYAVIVGVSEYKNPEYNLAFAHRDARAFHDFLLSPEGGAFPRENVRLLLNEQATASELRSALGTFLARTVADDYVIIFFTGHGASTPANPEDLYLLTHEADLTDLAGTAFPMDEVKRYLEKSIQARRVLMITDSCHSGGIKLMGSVGVVEDRIFSNYLDQLSRSRPGLISLGASGASQNSIEGTQFGGGHGIFTYYLLKGLTTDAALADVNADRIVDVAESYEYVRERVKLKTGGRQVPDKTGDLQTSFPLAVVSGDGGQGETGALSNDKPIQIVMGIFREDRQGKPVKINPGDTLFSGQGYYFLLQVEKPCWLYLYQVDAGGGVFRLFPNDEYRTGTNPVPAGRQIILPNSREVYFLDKTIGRETLYLFASCDKIPALERLKNGQKGDLDPDIKRMGPAGVRPRSGALVNEGREYGITVNELMASGRFVHQLSFEHK